MLPIIAGAVPKLIALIIALFGGVVVFVLYGWIVNLLEWFFDRFTPPPRRPPSPPPRVLHCEAHPRHATPSRAEQNHGRNRKDHARFPPR
jgi:hypothetical protein